MEKYQRGKIYKIVSDSSDEVYIGSTTEPTLARRLAKHRTNYNNYLNGKYSNYVTSFKILEQGAYSIVLLEDYPCVSKDQLHARERHYIESVPNCINKVIPTRSKQEGAKAYREKHKDKIANYQKEYYERNKEKLQEYKALNKERLRNRIICVCGGSYTSGHKTQHFNSKKHQKGIQE